MSNQLQEKINSLTRELKEVDPQCGRYAQLWDERVGLIRERDQI